MLGLVALLVAGMTAWAYTPLPAYALRSVRWAFRQLPQSLRARIDPQGRWELSARGANREAPQDHMERLELSLSMHRRDAMIEVLTKEGEEYSALFKKFIKANEPGFYGQLANTYGVGPSWAAKSLPRLREMLGDRGIPPAGVRAL